MLDHAEEAIALAHGRVRSDLDSDRTFELAMTRLLEVVGEAAWRVSPPTREQLPVLSWPKIVGLRNRLIHGYDEVDHDIMWNVVQHFLPDLIQALHKHFEH
jgi:uncharacterized protein with HEPN domain